MATCINVTQMKRAFGLLFLVALMALTATADTPVALDIASFATHQHFETSDEVLNVAVSQAGKRIAISLPNNRIIIMRLTDGKTIAEFKYQGTDSHRMKFSSDGELLFSRNVKAALFNNPPALVTVWRIQDQKLLLSTHPDLIGNFGVDLRLGKVHCADFSPEGKTVVFGALDENTPLCLLDLEAKKITPIKHDKCGYVADLTFSGDGKRIIAFAMKGPNSDNVMTLIIRTEDNSRKVVEIPENMRFVGFDRDQILMAERKDDQFVISDLQTKKIVNRIKADSLGNALLCRQSQILFDGKNFWDISKNTASVLFTLPDSSESSAADEDTIVTANRKKAVDVWRLK